MREAPASGSSPAMWVGGARGSPTPAEGAQAPRRALPLARRRGVLLLAVAAVLAASGLAFWTRTGRKQPNTGAWHAVQKRPFPAVVRETGTVVAKHETHVFSRFTGEIVWKIQEGAYVEPGTVIVRFDPAGTVDELERMRRELFDKEEAVRRAKADIASTTRRYELEAGRQQAALDKAVVDRDTLLARPAPDERKEAQLALASAQLTLEQTSRECEAYRELHALNFVTEAVLKQKALKLAGDKAEHAKARLLLQLALQGGTPDARRLAELAVADAQKNLATAVFNREADLVIKQAELELSQIELDNFTTSLELKKRELEDAEVKATAPGRVAFVDVWKGSKSLSPIQIGESRNRGQDLCKIVDTSVLRVKVWANEADVVRLAVGQAARLSLAAFPGRAFKGQVAEVALVVQDKNAALSSLALRRGGEAFVNVVAVAIDFLELTPEDRADLRLGFSAEAVIDGGAGAEACLVPWNAISADEAGRPSVVARKPGGHPERRSVRLGRSDAHSVEILEGLDGSEEVQEELAEPHLPAERGV